MKILDIDSLDITIAKDNIIRNASFDISSGDVVLLTGPNGCGKSTVLKILVGDVFDYSKLSYKANGVLFYKDNMPFNILDNEKNMEIFRKNICYISQEDDFESDSLFDCFKMSLIYYDIDNIDEEIYRFVKENEVYESFRFELKKKTYGFLEKKLAGKLGINLNQIEDSDYCTLKFLALNVKRMSGGQRKLANIMTNLIRYKYCKLIILDEPLNNLDYSNVRAFSNVLTRLYKKNPQLGILIVTHCKSIPIINKVLEIVPDDKIIKLGYNYICNSCFGKVNEQGLYI